MQESSRRWIEAGVILAETSFSAWRGGCGDGGRAELVKLAEALGG